MTDLEFMVSRPDGTRSSAVGLRSARRKVRAQADKYAAEKGRRMRLKERGDEDYGPWRSSLPETMERWEARVKGLRNGESVLLDIEDFPYTISTRAIDVGPRIPETAGNDDVDKIYGWLLAHQKGRNGGICVRKKIEGTDTWSQHCPWPEPDKGANAVDWFADPDTMDALFDDARALAAAARANPSEVPVGLILCGDQAWTPDDGWHHSGAAFHRHLHVQGRRTRTGTPLASC